MKRSVRQPVDALGGFIGVALALALALDPATARAADPRDDSRAAFLRGVAEAHQNHFTAARDAFLEAYRLFPHPSILLNLGVARMHTGEYVTAEEDLSRFLTDDGGAPPEDLADARATLQVVRKHIGILRLRVTPAGARATLDGAPLPLTPAAFVDVRAVVGPAALHVEADGYVTVDRQLIVDHDEVVPVEVQLLPAGSAAASRDADRAKEHPAMRHDVLGWSLGGAAGALAIAGTVAGVEAISFAHDYNTPGAAGYQDHALREEGVAWRTSADVLFGTAIVLGAVGTYFLVKTRGGGRDVHAIVGRSSRRLSFSF